MVWNIIIVSLSSHIDWIRKCFTYFLLYLFICLFYWVICFLPLIVSWKVTCCHDYINLHLIFHKIYKRFKKLWRTITIFATKRFSLSRRIIWKPILSMAAYRILTIYWWINSIVFILMYVTDMKYSHWWFIF
jgi:hypothetical protein